MSKVINVSLEEIINLAKKINEKKFKRINGKKLYRVSRSEGVTSKGDAIIGAIIDEDSVLYNYEQNFGFYDYKKSETVYFDADKHPYWRAYFGKKFFRLYDGLFLGHYRCGVVEYYIGTIIRAKAALINVKDGKDIVKKFDKDYKQYLAEKENIKGDKIRLKFGIVKNNSNDMEKFVKFLSYDLKNSHPDREIWIFWKWFINEFIDEQQYEQKIEETTKPEHEEVFKVHINNLCSELEKTGFEKVKYNE